MGGWALPLGVMLCVVLAMGAALGWGWVQRTPSEEELYGGSVRFLQDAWAKFRATGRFPWWSDHYLMGHSNACLMLCAVPILCGLVASSILGEPEGVKVAALTVLPLASVTMFVLVRRLLGNPWTAAVAAVMYVVSPEMLARLGDYEHWMGAYAYACPPLILWAFLRLGEDRAWSAVGWLALGWSAMLLSYAKLAFMFLPVAVAFAGWMWARPTTGRKALVVGSLAALGIVGVMAVVPLLPLVREFKLVTGFQHTPFAVWQRSFTLRSFASVLDRGGALTSFLTGAAPADRGQFYMGIVALGAMGGGLWGWIRRPVWREGDEARVFRLFMGLGLLSLWLCHGPAPLLESTARLAAAVAARSPALAPLPWLLALVPVGLLAILLPPTPRRWTWVALLSAGYLVVPALPILEWLPIFRDIRAPWGFWEVGFFTVPIAASIIVHRMMSRIRGRGWVVLAHATLLGIGLLDVSPYVARFFRPGLPSALFQDFANAQAHLAASPLEGRVLPLSSRYFYLRTPAGSGRSISTEESWNHFGLRGPRELWEAAKTGPATLAEFLRVAGVSHWLIDRTDPQLADEVRNALEGQYPVAFKSDHILVLENRRALYPAFVARNYIAVDPGITGMGQDFLTLATQAAAVPVEMGANAATYPYLAGTATAATGVFLGERREQQGAPAFRRVPHAAPRTNSMAMVFDVGSTREGWLVINEAWHPDWKASSGGMNLPVFKAFGAFMAVPLDRVEGPVRLDLVPPSWFGLCLGIGTAAWLVVLGVMVVMPLPWTPEWARRPWLGEAMPDAPPPAKPVGIARPFVVLRTAGDGARPSLVPGEFQGLRPPMEVTVIDGGNEPLSKMGPLVGMALAKGCDAYIEVPVQYEVTTADVLRMIHALEQGSECVVASWRSGGMSVHRASAREILGRWLESALMGVLDRPGLPDPTSHFFALRREAMEMVATLPGPCRTTMGLYRELARRRCAFGEVHGTLSGGPRGILPLRRWLMSLWDSR